MAACFYVGRAIAQDGELTRANALRRQVDQLYREGNFKAAITVARQEAALREKALGPDHPDVAQSLNNLAGLYRAQGRYAKAEPLFKRSLAIYEKVLGPYHPNVATSLNNLAGLYRAEGRNARPSQFTSAAW